MVFSRYLAMEIEPSFAPTITTPFLTSCINPKIRATNFADKPFKVTVPKIIIKVKGTNNSTSSLNEGGKEILSDIKYKENKEATAAATIPLGPIQATKAFSFQFKSDFHELIKTTIGRNNKTTTKNIYNELISSNLNSSIDILVDRIMNSTDIKITVRLSLKSRILSRLGVLILANNIPITVTDNKPDSACRVSAPANAKITKPKEKH